MLKKTTPCWGPIKALRALEAATLTLAGILTKQVSITVPQHTGRRQSQTESCWAAESLFNCSLGARDLYGVSVEKG